MKEQLQKHTEYCEQVIQKYLPAADDGNGTVVEAMNYSVEAGGKRLRPMFIACTCRMYGGRPELAEPFMAALEMIHTYSLVHDDLPAMDNDEYRRGRKTTHIVYGDGMAVLAGDGLLNYAYETALESFAAARDMTEKERVITALGILAGNAGIYGMVGGQCADLNAERKDTLTEDELIYIHEHKTACMIESGFEIGAVLAGASEEDIEKLGRIASNVGIAFQIQDDILDVTGDEKELGKKTGMDAADGKITYVTLFGLEKARQDVEALTAEALELFDELQAADTPEAQEEKAFLRSLILSLVGRSK